MGSKLRNCPINLVFKQKGIQLPYNKVHKRYMLCHNMFPISLLQLRANEFLNLDAILEGVMHKLVVRPLREHLYRLFVDEYSDNGAIQLLAENIKYARTKTPKDIGIRV